MKIAMIAPFDLPVPPPKYGGTESVVYHLTEGLVKRGHDVTLFAAEGSKTSAKLVSFSPPLGIGNESREALLPTLVYLNRIFQKAGEFDMIHNHALRLPLFFASLVKTPTVSTLHTPLPTSVESPPPGKYLTMQEFKEMPFVSISDDQRRNMPNLNFAATVYNGTVDSLRYSLGQGTGGYFAWIGRFSPEKGAHIAIKVAKKLGIPIKLAAKKDEKLPEYFDQKIAPHIDNKNVIYLGEIGEAEKIELLKGAIAFLNPIQWQEPFGLVVIESNVCGTPVVAYNYGSMAELIRDDQNGYISPYNDLADFIEKTKKIVNMSDADYQAFRARSRQFFIENYSIDKMVEGYIAVYEKLIKNNNE
ncbi:MAG: glycosyltransferase family 4 protein [Candidatus Berkelbacteria bacterium]|nr:glycosyltransferase family 4 protein [Candidatus Berkelbacteria bacterium]